MNKYILILFLIPMLFFTENNFPQWIQVTSGMGNITTSALTAEGNNLFAGGSSSGVYFSSNYGTNWTQTSLNSQLVFALLNSGNNVYAGTFNAGAYISTNNGSNWSQVSMGGNMTVWAFCLSGSNIFAGTFNPVTSNMGVHRSTDNGVSWVLAGVNNREVRSLAANGSYIFAGTIDSGIFISSNSGVNWFKSSLNNRNVRSIGINNNMIYAGSLNSQGVIISDNNGSTWLQSTLNNRDVNSLAVNGAMVIAGTTSNGVYVSNDNGMTWNQRNEGLSHLSVNALKIYNGFVFAGTVGGGVYKRNINELLGISLISEIVPDHFELTQNYPNPFNPVTNINFSIPKSAFVNITIYDALGKVVRELVNRQLSPGSYKADWDATNYPSGIYYYKLTSDDFTETKKMVLIK